MLLFLMLIMPPILVLPMILWNFHRGNDRMIYLLAFFMALWGMYYPPIGDQYRYFFIIKDFADFAKSMELQNYNLVILLCYLANIFEIHLEIIRAICVFISYSSVLAVATDIIRKSPRQELRLPMLLIVFLSINFWIICEGLRWGTACSLAIAGLYWLWVAGRRRLGVFLLIAAITTHLAIFFYLVLLSIFYFIMNICIMRYRVAYLLLCGLLFLTGKFLIFDIAFAIAPDWDMFEVYLAEDAYWNNGFLEDRNTNYMIGVFLQRIPCYLYFILSIFYWKKIRNKMQYFFLAGILGVIFTHSYANVTGRFFSFLLPFVAVLFIFNLRQIRVKFLITSALCIMLFCSFFNHYKVRILRDVVTEVRFLYLPGIMTCFHYYDLKYVKTKFTKDGNYFL